MLCCLVGLPYHRALSKPLSFAFPQVRAVKSGHVLVVDEADKAPTHVTCILKSLVESGEMLLGDGRRIVAGVLGQSTFINSV